MESVQIPNSTDQRLHLKQIPLIHTHPTTSAKQMMNISQLKQQSLVLVRIILKQNSKNTLCLLRETKIIKMTISHSYTKESHLVSLKDHLPLLKMWKQLMFTWTMVSYSLIQNALYQKKRNQKSLILVGKSQRKRKNLYFLSKITFTAPTKYSTIYTV